MMLCHRKLCHQVLFLYFVQKRRLSILELAQLDTCLELVFNIPSHQVVLIWPHRWEMAAVTSWFESKCLLFHVGN